MIREWDERKLKCFDEKGFRRYGLKWERGRKLCEYIYFPMRYLERNKEICRGNRKVRQLKEESI